jgi:hypothetical protein
VATRSSGYGAAAPFIKPRLLAWFDIATPGEESASKLSVPPQPNTPTGKFQISNSKFQRKLPLYLS